MKKKIFITGALRDYDSANPQAFTDVIEDYIKNNMVKPEDVDKITVSTFENSENELTLRFNFGTGRDIDPGLISREMYRCFTGECASFTAQNSIYWAMNFGPNYPMNVQFPIKDTIEAPKKNTNFYKANRYKSLEIEESPLNLMVKIKF